MRGYKHLNLTIAFLLVFINLKGQDIKIENVLWGNSESRKIYIGVANKFVIKTKNYDSLKIDRRGMNITYAQDTMVVYPKKTGKHTIVISTKNVSKDILFEANYFPDLVPQFNFETIVNKIERGSLRNKAQVVLYSEGDTAISKLFSIVQCQICVGGLIFDIYNNILSTSLIKEINALRSGECVEIRNCKLYHIQSKVQILMQSSTRYFIQ